MLIDGFRLALKRTRPLGYYLREPDHCIENYYKNVWKVAKTPLSVVCR